MPDALITVPDDFPSVFENTPAHERAKKIGETRVFAARGADEEQEDRKSTRLNSSHW